METETVMETRDGSSNGTGSSNGNGSRIGGNRQAQKEAAVLIPLDSGDEETLSQF
jgi:hypothetical protein